jgi:hypothetical protein
MRANVICVCTLVVLVVVTPLLAQPVRPGDDGGGAAPPLAPSPSRLAAGLRAYPDSVVSALLTLAAYPGLMQQLAEDPALLQQPEQLDPALPGAVLAAVRELKADPRVIALAAAHPQELEQLRLLRSVAPDGLKLRIGQLRKGYGRALLAAGAAWQGVLENDPVALGQYRELLTRFCKEVETAGDELPYVHARKREYYHGCAPNWAVVAFARDQQDLAALSQTLDRWWAAYAPERIDTLVQRSRADAGRTADAPDAVIGLPAQARRGMWSPADAGGADSLGRIPVMIQPLADQPLEAQREYALAEHARLWSPPPEMAPPFPEAPVAEGAEPEVEPGEPLPQPEEGEVIAEFPLPSERDARARGGRIHRESVLTRYGYGGFYYGDAWFDCGRYGYINYYGGLGWPYTVEDLERFRLLHEIQPGHSRLDGYVFYDAYGRRNYVGSGGVSVHVGPTRYYYRYPSARVRGTVTDVGVRRHYRSATEQVTRGLRRYPTYGGRVTGARRYSPNSPVRGIRRTGQQLSRRGATIGNRGRTTIGSRHRTTTGVRGPTTIGRRHSQRVSPSRGSLGNRGSTSYRRPTGHTRPRTGIQRGHSPRPSQPGVRSGSSRIYRPGHVGVSRGTTRTPSRGLTRPSSSGVRRSDVSRSRAVRREAAQRRSHR